MGKIKAIWEVAPLSVGCRMNPAITFEASMLVDSLRKTRHEITAIDHEIKKLCLSTPEFEYLLSIPGFGDTISATTLAAIGDHDRFDNTRQLLKMAGLDLSAKRSGKTPDNKTPHISKKANPI